MMKLFYILLFFSTVLAFTNNSEEDVEILGDERYFYIVLDEIFQSMVYLDS